MVDALPVLIAAFAPTADPATNARIIEAALDRAAADGARVVLTPECALTGYPSAAREDLAGADWCAVGDLEDRLLLRAERLGLLLVLGTAGRFENGVANEAFAGGAVAPVRYRKQCLTPTDRKHFTAGRDAALIEAFGWKLGLAICYDVRFADVFARLAAADADAFLVIAHMAGPDADPGTKAAVIPQLCATRAAEWGTPLAFCTASVADRYLDSGAWDARGIEIARIGEGLLRVDLRKRETYAPWYGDVRREHLARWHASRSGR